MFPQVDDLCNVFPQVDDLCNVFPQVDDLCIVCFLPRLMIYVTTIIDGVDEQSRIVRRTLARYMTMASLIVFQATSVSVKKRFPTMDHLIEAGRLAL